MKLLEEQEYCFNAVSIVDPTGNHLGVAIGAALGAAAGAYSASQANLQFGSLQYNQTILVGALSGAVAGTGVGGLVGAGLMAYAGSVLTQASTGAEKIDHLSAGVSAEAAMAGSALTGIFQIPNSVIGNSLENITT